MAQNTSHLESISATKSLGRCEEKSHIVTGVAFIGYWTKRYYC